MIASVFGSGWGGRAGTARAAEDGGDCGAARVV